MNREINIRLNANRAKAVHTGHKFASGDKGIVFRIAVDELDTTGTTAKIVFKRSNGTSVEAGITGKDGIYSYTSLGNEFAVVGPVTADVKFYEKENRVSTCTFVFDVTSDTLDGIGAGTAGYSDTLERMKKSMEQAEADILAAKVELENRAEEILQQMKDTAESAEEDVETAEQKMDDLSADLEALYQEYVDAFGSTGPFNPRGPYSETETYTVRDMVSHNDASWVCYRNCTGATPSKESDCWQYLAAGDAKTLDGHGADYFLSILGGEIEADEAYLDFKSTVSNRVLRVTSTPSGNLGLYDVTNGEWILIAYADGTNLVNATASGNLPLTGGKISKASGSPLEIENTVTDICAIAMFGLNNHLGSLGFHKANNPVMFTTTGEIINLLHTGNKPSGAYTGNGDATERTIDTSGLGSGIIIGTAGVSVIVLAYGTIIIKNGTLSSLSASQANFIGGVLKLATTDTNLNASGNVYYWQVF